MVAMAAPARKKNKKRGFLQSSTFYLILLFVSFVLMAMLIGRIFSGAGIGEKLCAAVPWFCGSEQYADYFTSEQSTNTFVCAVGTAATGALWPGGPNLNCNEFYDKSTTAATGGGGGTESGVTGAAVGSNPAETITTAKPEEKKYTLDELRKLKPSVSCSKDANDKMTCKVKNFIMPQELAETQIAGITLKPEEWIPFWGDPHYLIYWNSFPTEEDTWNFKVGWVHHVVIAAISVLPVTKTAALSFKTFFTALKGAGKSELRTEVARYILKETSTEILGTTLTKLGTDPKVIAKVVGKEVSDEVAEQFGKEMLSKLSKKELQTMVKSWGVKYTTGQALKDVMRRGLVNILKKRAQKLGIPSVIRMGVKFATMELALAALADSIMKKYEPVGNAIVIKNPGAEENARKIFELPKEMEHVPVLVKWEPVGSDEPVLKNAYFASPCYMKEFSVSREGVVCRQYTKNGIDTKAFSCEGAYYDTADRYKCGEVNWEAITSYTRDRMGNTIKSLIDKDDKKLFEINDSADVQWAVDTLINEGDPFDENDRGALEKEYDSYKQWDLEKIYLPWLSTGYFSSLATKDGYYLEDIEFKEGLLRRGSIGEVWDLPRTPGFGEPNKGSIRIGENILHYLPVWEYREEGSKVGYTETYDSRLRCGKDCYFLLTEDNKDDVIMSSGKEYILSVEGSQKGGVVVDVYDVDRCTEVSLYEEEKFSSEGIMKCNVIKETAERIKAGKGQSDGATFGRGFFYEKEVTGISVDSQISLMRNTINALMGTNSKYVLRIVPKGDIKAEQLDDYNGAYLDSFVDCKTEGLDDGRVCIRTLEDSISLSKNIKCRGVGKSETISLVGEQGGKEITRNIASMSCTLELPKPFQRPLQGGNKELKSVTLSMYFSLDGDGNVLDKSYSSLTFETGVNNVFTQFGDDDEDGLWDQISVERGETTLDRIAPDCLFGKSEDKFKIKLSDIGIDGNKNKDYGAYPLYMENCKTDAIVISFNGDNPDTSKLETDSANYCLRNTRGFIRFINSEVCGVDISDVISAALFVASSVVADGASTVLLVAAAAEEAYSEVGETTQQYWP